VSKHSPSEAEILRRLDEWVQLNKHAPLPSNPIGLSEEARMSASLDVRDLRKSEIRRGLNQLVQTLTRAAGSAAADQKAKFTDTERELLRRHSDILPGAVAELTKILTDHPLEHVREYRLAKLFEALGSTTFIASRVIKNETRDRLQIAAAVNVRSAGAKEIKRIIAEEMAQRDCNGPVDKATAEHIRDAVCKRAGRDVQAGTIQKYARALRKTD
jgi:hypothetical protein